MNAREASKQMIIGIDPHKMSHTANAVDPATNTTTASVRIDEHWRAIAS